MVGDTQRHFYRLNRVVAMEFPDHRVVGAGRTRLSRAWSRGRGPFRGSNLIASQSSLSAFDAVLLVKRENLLLGHGRLVAQCSVRELKNVLLGGLGYGDLICIFMILLQYWQCEVDY